MGEKRQNKKNGVKQQKKKPFPSPGYRSARFAVQIYLHFCFLSPNPEPGPLQASGKSTTKKKRTEHVHKQATIIWGSNIKVYGVRLVGIRSKVYQR